jgi:RecA/RadA recombinase
MFPFSFNFFTGCCAYIDVENAFDPYFAEDIGVDTEKLLITHPVCAEKTLSIVNTLINTESIDVIVVDSVSPILPFPIYYLIFLY